MGQSVKLVRKTGFSGHPGQGMQVILPWNKSNDMETVKLNNGIEMPVLGLGTFLLTDPDTCERSISEAIRIGYRLIDTAQGYGNEEYIGRAVAGSDVAREELFITTKVWFKNYEHTRASVEESMRKLQTDYLDLVLLHWPFGNTYAAWRELEELYAAGRIRAIGVSNYTSDRLIDLILYNKVVPAVNQIETNLISQQTEIYRWMKKYRIQHEGYAPFGQGKIDALYDDPVLMYIADRYHKTVRQVVLRFQIQSGVVVIPKTMHPDRLKENFEVFDFGLEANEMEILRSFDKATPLIGNPQDPVTVASSIEW